MHNYTNPARTEKPIYERLYDLRAKEEAPVLEKQGRFKPDISVKSKKLVRHLPIADHLYGDALRRQERQSNVEPKRPSMPGKSVNLTNERYVAQKFIKDLYSALEAMELDSSKPLDYITFN